MLDYESELRLNLNKLEDPFADSLLSKNVVGKVFVFLFYLM